jgi:hypothetical protein
MKIGLAIPRFLIFADRKKQFFALFSPGVVVEKIIRKSNPATGSE